MGPAQPGEGVQQDDDVPALLDQPLGAFERELGQRDVLLGGPVEGGGVNLAPYRSPHVGDLLGALVEQHHHQVALGVVLGDRGRDLLEQYRLAGPGRGHDEPALALADRGDEVDDARRRGARGGFQTQPPPGVKRGEVTEVR